MSLVFVGEYEPAGRDIPAVASAELLLLGLAAIVRADFGYPPCEAAQYLRESASHLGVLGVGDPELLNLLGSKWEAADVIPSSATLDRQRVNEQIAELLRGWFS